MTTPQKNIVKNAVAQEVGSKGSAIEHKSKKISLVWVVPAIAMILMALLLWNHMLNMGPVIQITTNSASGIEEGKTLVKMRSVNVGMVTDVVLSPDYKKTILTVQMDKNTDDLLRKDTDFWVVKPRVESAGISGLDTILSGAYIQLSIGESAEYASEFVALDDPPVRQDGENGILVSLFSKDPLRISSGDNVSFRGFNVGVVTESKLDVDSQRIHYRAFIREPYDALVNHNTKFWISSGVEFELSPAGASVRTESIDNLVTGGISFDNFIDNQSESVRVPNDTVFTLYNKREDARISALGGSLLYVVMLENSIYNIKQGSLIYYRGVKVGEVVKSPWFDDNSEVFTAKALPVMIAIDSDSLNRHHVTEALNGLLKKNNLCAGVGSANLIIANNQIELSSNGKEKCTVPDHLKKMQYVERKNGLMTYRGINVIPIKPSQSLDNQLNQLMEKLNEFDVAGFSTELQNSLKAFAGAMDAFTESNTAVKRTNVIEKLSEAFENLNKSVKGYGPDTDLYKSIEHNLHNIEQILQDISPVVSEAGQSPKALIFGSPNDPIPTAPKK